jgi:autotransporter translocation and assembly factor TamB
MNGDLQMNGTFENPVVSGTLECANTQLNLPTVPVEAENVRLTMNINANQVEFLEATGNANKGKFLITGKARLEKLLPADYWLTVSGSDVYYKNSFFDGYGNLKVNVTGSLMKTLFAGDISVNNCRIGISGGHGRARKQSWSPEFDLTIKAGKNVRYRQIGIADVNVTGEIQVKGNSAEPILSGKVTSEKGVLTLYGQNFIVQHGLAVFKPENKYLPYLEIDSIFKSPKAEVFLSLKGQVGVDLMTSLTSQPYLTQTEIFAVLNWPELNGEQPTFDGMLGNNLSFVTDSLFGDVFNGVRNTLHLDYFYLDTNYTENEFRINMGDYVTDELFISYSRSLISGDPKESWGFDYHLTPELVIGGTYSLEDQMTWKLTYGFRFK